MKRPLRWCVTIILARHRVIATLNVLFALLSMPAEAAISIMVSNATGEGIANAMVSLKIERTTAVDSSDNGYPTPGTAHFTLPEITRFTDRNGQVSIDAPAARGNFSLRIRKPGYKDKVSSVANASGLAWITLDQETDLRALAQSKPSNLWLSQLSFRGFKEQAAVRQHFLLHCAFCHQQAAVFTRTERSPEQWLEVIDRMNLYGAQVAWDFRQPLAEYLSEANRALVENYTSVPDFETWKPYLRKTEITEWPIGDGFSQMHDFLVHPNGFVYIGDNLMDRLYELNPATGAYQVYKVPHTEDAKPGGILGNRFATYPKTENYNGLHSLAVSPLDGHIFITPSMQQQLLEFDPVSKQFTSHKMDEGFYPHTIRVDSKGRVWFTLALSSQVAMFDRNENKFTYYDLPPRGFKERLTIATIKRRLGNGDVGELPKYDMDSTGFPMPYGIDVSPSDDSIWVSRLYADDIAHINPETGKIKMIKTPFKGPRRLRCDAQGNVWIIGFASGLIAKYDPKIEEFTKYPLPVISEAPYSLNVDRERATVWVNGNQSDTILSMDIGSGEWKVYPMPRYRTFTRDIEFGADGSVYTTNSHFPSWLIEGGLPTLIRIKNN